MNSAEHRLTPDSELDVPQVATANPSPLTNDILVEDALTVVPQHAGLTPLSDKIRRAIWNVVYVLLFRFTPRTAFGWRRLLLCAFGARLSKIVYIYPSAKIYAPWNLEMGDRACLGPDVDCYCMGKITLGNYVTVSQYSYLCSGTHDITDISMRLYSEPIVIEESAWVCADAFIGPGVTVGQGAVVGARASVFGNVAAWTVVGGNPAKFIKKRIVTDAAQTSHSK